jgi:ferredoxin-NADP reductase
MANYEVILKGREDLAEGTVAFHFAKPAGFSFKPGQAVDIALLNPPAEANSTHRIFSLVSAPFEEELAVATRMRENSAFKRTLNTLPPGAQVKLKGPLGIMTLHEDGARAAVFIAGGIGITPFMSMLRQAAHDRLAHRLFLLYSNRRPEDAAFLAELQALERQNENFRLLATMTDMDKSARAWHGEQGMVDEDRVKRFVGAAAAPIYYLAGPPVMVDAMSAVLSRAGVQDDDVRSEEFYGY